VPTAPYLDSPRSCPRTVEDESGQGLVEYGLIIAIVSMAAILLLAAIGLDVKDLLERALHAFP
jgi:Flp pilus assembly pilin Flp